MTRESEGPAPHGQSEAESAEVGEPERGGGEESAAERPDHTATTNDTSTVGEPSFGVAGAPGRQDPAAQPSARRPLHAHPIGIPAASS
jgi:hypothetical protein